MRILLYFTVLTCALARLYCVDENMHVKESVDFTNEFIVCRYL